MLSHQGRVTLTELTALVKGMLRGLAVCTPGGKCILKGGVRAANIFQGMSLQSFQAAGLLLSA